MSIELASASSLVASGERLDWERVRLSTLAALDAARAEQTILVVSVGAPLIEIEEVLRLRSGDAVLWAPGKGPQVVGLGACQEITGSGRDRFAQVRSKAEALFLRMRVVAESVTMPQAPPVLLGGFAFQAEHAQTGGWSGFGDARFVLPKLSYVRDERRAALRLALLPEDLRVETVCDELVALERLRSELAGLEPAPLPGKPRLIAVEELGEAAFTRCVEEILSGIGRGEFEKVVAARSVRYEISPAPDPVRVLARLRVLAPECTRFALRRGAATFLGATPERLVSLRAGVVETEALAASIRAGDPARHAELLDSSKERVEHELVADELVRRLEALATEIRRPSRPEVRSLRHVLHLWTPIRAVLREPLHVLELVERLHPTPAVGGVPTADALRFIAEREPGERGWYAGPIGWCDARGEGEFAVALRSGLLEGSHADLYAGAGIVRASIPHSEWLETRLKLMALTSALGLDPEELTRERS